MPFFVSPQATLSNADSEGGRASLPILPPHRYIWHVSRWQAGLLTSFSLLLPAGTTHTRAEGFHWESRDSGNYTGLLLNTKGELPVKMAVWMDRHDPYCRQNGLTTLRATAILYEPLLCVWSLSHSKHNETTPSFSGHSPHCWHWVMSCRDMSTDSHTDDGDFTNIGHDVLFSRNTEP